VSAYRLIASAWALLLFAGGALLLRRAGASALVAALYGFIALLPYSVSTAGTCSNYAPAIGLGQLLAAAACAAILTSEPSARRLAVAIFVGGSWTGVLFWTDFVFPALFGTFYLVYLAGARLAERAGLSRRTARLLAGTAVLLLGAFGGGVLFLAVARGALGVKVPRNLGAVGPKTMVFIALLALGPLAVAAAAGPAIRRLAAKPEAEGKDVLASFSIALASLTACAFLLTSWAAVSYERESPPFPGLGGLVAEHVRAFFSNAFAWDQDRLSWKFWFGTFGWHDVFYPDAVYAFARWGFVALLVSFPFLAAPFLRRRPAAACALLLVSGAAVGCGAVTFTLRFFAPTVPYGRFVLPLVALAALPLLAMLEADGRERWGRAALLASAAIEVWTAIVVLGARYAYGG
jgi:hypothetical protein